MTSHLKIAAATCDDLQPLCELFFELFEHQNRGATELFRMPARADTSEGERLVSYIQGILDADEQALFVAKRAAARVGFVHVRTDRAPESASVPFRQARCEGWIQHIAVAADSRQTGVGRALVDASREWALQQGATSVGLQVWGFNQSARAFFEKLGFGVRTVQLSSELHGPTAGDL